MFDVPRKVDVPPVVYRLHSLCRFPPPQQTLAKLRAHINGLRVLALSGVRLAKSTLARRPQPRTCGSLQRLFGGTCELLSVKFDSNLFHPQISSSER